MVSAGSATGVFATEIKLRAKNFAGEGAAVVERRHENALFDGSGSSGHHIQRATHGVCAGVATQFSGEKKGETKAEIL